MLSSTKTSLLLLLIGLFNTVLVTTHVQAQRFKGHWYVDPTTPLSLGYVPVESGCMPVESGYVPFNSTYAPFDSSCVPVDPNSMSGPMPRGMVTGASGSARAANRCPPPTNALLRVWVDDRATVWVNGQETKPQRLAGIHRGSRIFSLTHLLRDEMREATIEVALYIDGVEAVRMPATILEVRAGKTYESFFPPNLLAHADMEEVSPSAVPYYPPPVTGEAARPSP